MSAASLTRIRMVLVWLSIVLGAFTSLAYYWQPDWLTAFTIWPAWFWFSAGVALALAGYSRPTRKLILSAALLWGGVEIGRAHV